MNKKTKERTFHNWSIAARFQAGRDLIILTGTRRSAIDPFSGEGSPTTKVGIDTTRPKKEGFEVPLQKVHMKELDQNDLAGMLRKLCSGYCSLSVPVTHRRVRKPLTRNKDPKQTYDNSRSKLWKHSCRVISQVRQITFWRGTGFEKMDVHEEVKRRLAPMLKID